MSEEDVYDEYIGADIDDEPEIEPEQDSEESDLDLDELERELDKDSDLDITSVSSFIKEIVIVGEDNRLTSDIMSKFEMTECTSIRAVQIARHNNCMVDITGLIDPVLMAKREMMMRKVPLTLRRYVGECKSAKGESESYYEYWNPNEMIYSTTYNDVL